MAVPVMDADRSQWSDDDLDRAFCDALHEVRGTDYPDGRTAFLGAYSSVLHYGALGQACGQFTDDELRWVITVNRATGYFSPIYGLLASWTEHLLERRVAGRVGTG